MSDADRLALLGGPPAVTSPAPAWPEFGDPERNALESVLQSRVWGGYHPAAGVLESRMAALHDSAFGIATANGTVSLEIALLAAGIGPGDEVIVPPISFVASATAIARSGAVPVFADVDPETINLDPAAAARAVTERTRAIMLVHFAGHPADLDAFVALAGERKLVLIEDCAHAPGATWRGRKVGSFGAFGSFSFQASKNLTAGEGGLLVTNDPELAATARSIVHQGRRAGGAWYEHVRLGTNARLTGFQAALLLAQLDRLPDQIARRSAAAERLRSALSSLSALAPTPHRVDPRVDIHAYHLFSMRLNRGRVADLQRDLVLEALSAEGVPVTAGYPHPLYRNPLFARHEHRVEPCPHAERYCRDSLWLPHQVLLAPAEWLEAAAAGFRKVFNALPALRADHEIEGGLRR